MTDDPGIGYARAARWALPAALAALAVATELGGDGARVALRFQRDAVLDGELWRLVTGNLAHLGPRHLALNLVGLALVVALDGRALAGARGVAVAAGAMLAVGVGLLAWSPEVAWYVGLSGALHGMLAALALEALSDPDRRRWGGALALAVAFKLGWERLAGPMPFTAAAAGGPVVVAAHLYGAIGGAAVQLAWWSASRSRGAARL